MVQQVKDPSLSLQGVGELLCCGTVSIPGPETSMCHRYDQKKKNFIVELKGAILLLRRVFVPYCYYNNMPQTSSLKQYKFIVLWFWRSQVRNGSRWAKIKVSAGLCSFRRAWERSHSLASSSF